MTDASPNTTASAAADVTAGPYGITPYVARAVVRIQQHFRDSSDPLRRKGEAFVVGVFGEWGSGKSTVLDAIGASFNNKPPENQIDPLSITALKEVTLKVEFNAWRFEREEHLLVPLLKTIQRTLDAYIKDLKIVKKGEPAFSRFTSFVRAKVGPNPGEWLLDRAQLLGACTIALTRMVKMKAGLPGLGEIEINPYEALKSVQEQIDRAKELAPTTQKERPLESLYYDLFEHLQKLTLGMSDKDRNKLNFVFLVDDLDRCLPEKAVEMLEAIKLFLDVEGCAFVLALDDEVIERGIAHRYRDYLRPVVEITHNGDSGPQSQNRDNSAGTPPITGHEYLEKIVQLPFRLPRWSRREVREFLQTRYADFFARWNVLPMDPLLASAPPVTDTWLLELIVQAVPPMPRNLVRAIELLDFTRSVAEERKLGDKLHAYPLAQLVLLQLFAPQCFRFLRRGHAEGWKTFEKRLKKNNIEFGTGYEETLRSQPAIFSEGFFTWWEKFCGLRTNTSPDPYIDGTELPLIAHLRAACRNRGGFDPRNLFLLSQEAVHVDDVLEPYFSLFSENIAKTMPAAHGAPPPAAVPPAPPTEISKPVVLSPRPATVTEGTDTTPSAPGAPPPAAAPPAPPTEIPKPVVPSPRPATVTEGTDTSRPLQKSAVRAASLEAVSVPTASPRDRDEFIRQLLSPTPESWRNAVSREESLIGRTLDDRTVDQLILRLREPNTPSRNSAWLEIVSPLLNEDQFVRLLRETGTLRELARAAGLVSEEPSSAKGVPS